MPTDRETTESREPRDAWREFVGRQLIVPRNSMVSIGSTALFECDQSRAHKLCTAEITRSERATKNRLVGSVAVTVPTECASWRWSPPNGPMPEQCAHYHIFILHYFKFIIHGQIYSLKSGPFELDNDTVPSLFPQLMHSPSCEHDSTRNTEYGRKKKTNEFCLRQRHPNDV